MARYSRVHRVGEKSFRYDYEKAILGYVAKPDKEMLEDNNVWREKYGIDLWDVEDGYVVVACIGLSRDDWKECPKYWCECYASNLDAEVAYMI